MHKSISYITFLTNLNYLFIGADEKLNNNLLNVFGAIYAS